MEQTSCILNWDLCQALYLRTVKAHHLRAWSAAHKGDRRYKKVGQIGNI